MRAFLVLCLALTLPWAFGAFDALAKDGNENFLWRIGKKDGSSKEFTSTLAAMPPSYTVDGKWATQTAWPEWPSRAPSGKPWTTTINYKLTGVPSGGALFKFKPVNASTMVPELAVYSNFAPCGIIQVGGAQYPGFGPAEARARTFSRTYEVYIPAQFLVAGANKLQLQALGSPYNRDSATFLAFTIDYLELDALNAPPVEPLNGKITYIGFNEGTFPINPGTIAIEQAEAEWAGVAYCGDPERVAFWNDLTGVQSPTDRLAYLQRLKSLDMRAILDGWNCARTTDSEIVNGTLPANAATYIGDLFKSYGSYVQFYELCNEPCMNITSASQKYCTAVARYVQRIKPPHLLLASPGYAYGGGRGDPVNWDDGNHDANRTALDKLCDAYNGHAYGSSYAYDNGSLVETIDAHGTYVNGNPQVTHGWDKPFIVTECGSGTMHVDFHEACTSTQTIYSSALDRDIRAHIGFADYFCVHAMFGDDPSFRYIKGTQTDTATWVGAPANAEKGDTDTRLKTFRRLALAYGTHGAPLKYNWQTPLTSLLLVYFRAVDTSTLPPLPGSKATSSKILLSFVNFDLQNANTIAVTVTMPAAKTYAGVSYTAANSYTEARVPLAGLVAKPDLPLTVQLGPGESVEYILDR